VTMTALTIGTMMMTMMMRMMATTTSVRAYY